MTARTFRNRLMKLEGANRELDVELGIPRFMARYLEHALETLWKRMEHVQELEACAPVIDAWRADIVSERPYMTTDEAAYCENTLDDFANDARQGRLYLQRNRQKTEAEWVANYCEAAK